MNAYAAALAILTDGPLTRTSIKDAISAALLVSADHLPGRPDDIEAKINTRSRATLGSAAFRRRKSNGEVTYEPLAIEVSLACAAIASVEELADTIAHEVAHIVAGHEAHHDADWKRAARRAGATPERCASNPDTERSHRYAYYCPGCEAVVGRAARKPKRRKGCRTCSSLVATVNLGDRGDGPEVVHTVSVNDEQAARRFTEVIDETVADYLEAWDAIITLNKTS